MSADRGNPAGSTAQYFTLSGEFLVLVSPWEVYEPHVSRHFLQ
jgi:hypothetical protein